MMAEDGALLLLLLIAHRPHPSNQSMKEKARKGRGNPMHSYMPSLRSCYHISMAPRQPDPMFFPQPSEWHSSGLEIGCGSKPNPPE